MKLSIAIPCYNEEKNIPLILEGFNAVIKRDDIEVIIINNGSNDKSGEILNKVLPQYRFAKSVDIEVNQGYGFGIISGLKEAQGEYIGWTHGDLQTSPGDIIKALEIIESRGNPKKIYVKGNRKGRPLVDSLFTLGMSAFEYCYLGEILYDINAQPNIFHKSFYEGWVHPPYDFALDVYALYMAKKQGVPIVRFPVMFPKRIHGESHWNKNMYSKWKFIKRTVLFSVQLKKEL